MGKKIICYVSSCRHRTKSMKCKKKRLVIGHSHNCLEYVHKDSLED